MDRRQDNAPSVDTDAEKGGNDATESLKEVGAAHQEFPEGGARAWATASGTALIMFCTLGYVNSWGYVTKLRRLRCSYLLLT
jgi:hypothetical protein